VTKRRYWADDKGCTVLISEMSSFAGDIVRFGECVAGVRRHRAVDEAKRGARSGKGEGKERERS